MLFLLNPRLLMHHLSFNNLPIAPPQIILSSLQTHDWHQKPNLPTTNLSTLIPTCQMTPVIKRHKIRQYPSSRLLYQKPLGAYEAEFPLDLGTCSTLCSLSPSYWATYCVMLPSSMLGRLDLDHWNNQRQNPFAFWSIDSQISNPSTVTWNSIFNLCLCPVNFAFFIPTYDF